MIKWFQVPLTLEPDVITTSTFSNKSNLSQVPLSPLCSDLPPDEFIPGPRDRFPRGGSSLLARVKWISGNQLKIYHNMLHSDSESIPIILSK